MLYKTIQLFIFDLQGTLIPRTPVHDNIVQSLIILMAFSKYEQNLPQLHNNFYTIYNQTYSASTTLQQILNIPLKEARKIVKKAFRIFYSHYKPSVPEKTIHILKTLKKRQKHLILLSNTSEKYISRYFNLKNIEPLFDYTFFTNGKGKYNTLRKILKLYPTISQEKILMIGDSYYSDILPAQKLGIKAILLKGVQPNLPKNVPTITDLEELLKVYY